MRLEAGLRGFIVGVVGDAFADLTGLNSRIEQALLKLGLPHHLIKRWVRGVLPTACANQTRCGYRAGEFQN
jgi:hypothetical protein